MALKGIFGLYIFIIGTIFASFFGVIISRVPNGMSIITPSSRCDICGHEIKWYENIPILSFIFLKGKCKNCKNSIDKFYFVYEIIGGLSLLLIFAKLGLSYECLLEEIIVLTLLLIAGYDYKTKEVLDIFLIVLVISCFGLFIYRVVCLNYEFKTNIISVILALLFIITLRLVMSKMLKKEALGLGDVYIIAIMGLVFNPIELLLSITLASSLGSIINIIKIKKNNNLRNSEIAFCPYLCFGFYTLFLFGNKLTDLLVG